ncbi:MAG: hypothetical protein ACREX9_18480 [Gammaproteobacteria bacterium]
MSAMFSNIPSCSMAPNSHKGTSKNSIHGTFRIAKQKNVIFALLHFSNSYLFEKMCGISLYRWALRINRSAHNAFGGRRPVFVDVLGSHSTHPLPPGRDRLDHGFYGF